MTQRGLLFGALTWTVALAGVWLGAATDATADRIRVEVDKATLIRLEKDADVVFIGNPSIADVTVESPRMLFILGLFPGETSLRILDSDGKDVVATNIVVVPTEERTVTVNRNVAGAGQAEITYSCDPRCALVRTPSAVQVQAEAIGTTSPSSTGADSASDGGTYAGEQLAIPAPEATQ
jgi:Flp pilus assembly secretin CpaC